jgi:hypothetical protein
MRILLNYVFAMLTLFVFASETAGQVCDAKAFSKVYFSDYNDVDTLEASINGATCDDAMFVLSIKNHASKQIHERKIPVADLVPCGYMDANDERAQQSCVLMVNRAVSPVRIDELRCGKEPSGGGCTEYPALSRLRRTNPSALCFFSGYERTTCVAYDSEAESVVEVFGYGM